MSVKLSNILNGWQNFISKSEVTEELKNERGKHCVSCTDKKYSKTLQAFIKDDLKEVEGYVCLKCPSVIKCPLSAKLLSEKETCPKKLW